MDIETQVLSGNHHLLTLDELAHLEKVPELWSDKRSPRKEGEIYVCHDYLRLYDREWSKWRDQPIRLLEIGLNVGASIKLWLQYFTKAKIVGMDIVDFKFGMPVDEDLLHRFQFVKGDQFSPYDLERFRESQDLFDIIIDDGAHFSGPIEMSYNYLWGHVKSGGYYVIEDLREVLNPASHTPGYGTQIDHTKVLLERAIMGSDIAEIYASKDLIMMRKK